MDGGDDEHDSCRVQEFARWPRVVLEHEREFLSSVMATSVPFLDSGEKSAILHDLADIDACLAACEKKVKL